MYIVVTGVNFGELQEKINKESDKVIVHAGIIENGNLFVVMTEGTRVNDYVVVKAVNSGDLQVKINKNPTLSLLWTETIENGNIYAIIGDKQQGGSTDGMFIGYVTNGDTFPIKRPDGNPLTDMDYVKPKSDSTFPFVVNGKTIKTRFDKVYYIGGEWYVEEGLVPNTAEIIIKDVEQESVNGIDSLATTQAGLNAEYVEEFKKKLRTDAEQVKWWGKTYMPNVYIQSMNGALVTTYSTFMNKLKEIVDNPDSEEEDTFVPYSFSTTCLVKSIDLTSDIALDAIHYGKGKRIVVAKYVDADSKERYKVYEVDLTLPVKNKFVQTTLSDVWYIQHNLLKYPSIQISDENDELVLPSDIEYIDLMMVKIKFSEPIKGYAILN